MTNSPVNYSGAATSAKEGITRKRKADAKTILRRLLWLYFWLLIFEGAMRKWLWPQFSAPLLIIRDPLVMGMYFLALRHDLFPQSGFLKALLKLAIICGFIAVLQFLLLGVSASVLVYGWRTAFLHLPLIFLVPEIFGLEDLRRLGKWMLVLAIPMTLLMAYQFKSPSEAWINRAPGLNGGKQLYAAMQRVRPPGTFSFITGPVCFFSLAAAYLLFAMRKGREGYSPLLLAGAGISVILAGAISGSRSVIVSAGIVMAGWLLGLAASRQASSRVPRTLLLVGLSLLVLTQVGLFKEGTEVLSTRWEMAASSERAGGGMAGRILNSLVSPLMVLPSVPLLGEGLGVGTNVGAHLLTGHTQFLLAEEEWGRLVLEMGPLVGLAFILFRVTLAVWLARQSVQCASAGHLLPLLLFSACAANLLTGQIAQPNILGFTALGTGLCLSAIKGVTVSADQQTWKPRSPRWYPLKLCARADEKDRRAA